MITIYVPPPASGIVLRICGFFNIRSKKIIYGRISQKADDGNDHEKFDEGKPSPSFCGFVRTGCLKISLGIYHGFKKYTENWGWVKPFLFHRPRSLIG